MLAVRNKPRDERVRKLKKTIPQGSIPVVINNKTTVYVHHVEDVAVVREKYAYLNDRRY